MVNLPVKTCGSYNSQNIENINSISCKSSISNNTLLSINSNKAVPSSSPASQTNVQNQSHTITTQTILSRQNVPNFLHSVQKGQKINIFSSTPSPHIDVNFGWNIKNTECDVDVSAFLLGSDGKVLGDSWFVFYGQTSSPDNTVTIKPCLNGGRELIHIDLARINSSISKIVFVLTINEAFTKKLNFQMIEDAYILILAPDGQELTSFLMTDYYSNVISMMIGEVYQYKGIWKFNAVGNGVAKDLAGLCELYGVQVQ